MLQGDKILERKYRNVLNIPEANQVYQKSYKIYICHIIDFHTVGKLINRDQNHESAFVLNFALYKED